MSIHVAGPFGGCDEQAETDAYEALFDSLWEARELSNLLAAGRYGAARRRGYSDAQIAAWEHLG